MTYPVDSSRFIRHFLGWAPVATNIVTPLVVHYQLRNKPVAESERRLLVMQETVRQFISGAIGLVTYYGGGWLTDRTVRLGGKIFSGRSAQHLAKTLGGGHKTTLHIVGGTIAQFIGYGFIRPLVSTELILQWLKKSEQSAVSAAKAPALNNDVKFQSFLQSVQERCAAQRPMADAERFKGTTANPVHPARIAPPRPLTPLAR